MAEALLAALPPSLLNAANQALAQRLRAEAAQLGQQQRRLAAAHRALQERTQYLAAQAVAFVAQPSPPPLWRRPMATAPKRTLGERFGNVDSNGGF